MKIRTLVLTRLIPAFTLLALVLGVICVVLIRVSVSQNQQAILSTTLASVDDQLQAIRFQAKSTGELLSLSDEVLHYSVTQPGYYQDVALEPRVLHLFQQAISTYTSLKSVSVASEDHKLLLRVAENYDPDTGLSPQEVLLLKKLQESQQPHVEGFFLERGTPAISYAFSVNSDLAQSLGKSYLILHFSLDSIAHTSERLWKESRILLILLNDRDQVIAAPEMHHQLAAKMVASAKRSTGGAFRHVKFDSDQYSYVALDSGGYRLIAMVPMQVMNHLSLYFAAIALAVIGFFMILGILLVALFVKRHLVNPITRLTEVVQRRAGGDDIGFEQPGVVQEIKHLANTFERVVAAEQKARSQIQSLAYYDTLTGLVNRRMFVTQLSRAVAACRRNGESLAVLFMDLDNFKSINDTHGHHYGDKVLVEFAKRLVQTVRGSDLVSVIGDESEGNRGIARFAGDEFAILLTGLHDSFTAAQVVERLLDTVRKPFLCEDQEFNLTASIGIAAYPDDAQTAQQLMEHADAAMYQAKLQGKDTYCFFSGELSKQLERQRRIQEALRYALQQDEFQMLFQPYVNREQRICGAEVLLRWQSAALGHIPPLEFIPMAEANGMIRQIDAWVTVKAMALLHSWQEKGLPLVKLAVNLSGVALKGGEYVDLVTANLKTLAIDPSLLELEVGERELTDPDEDTLAVLHALKQQGVGLVLDDFGKGMTSLRQLKELPLDVLKLNHDCIQSLADQAQPVQTVDALLAVSRAYQVLAMAKGVEESVCADYLKAAGCDYLQGYYFSEPLTQEQFEALLREDRLTLPGSDENQDIEAPSEPIDAQDP